MKPFSRLRTQQRHRLSEVIPLSKPYTLTIDPCGSCNFRCTQCLQSTSGGAFPRGFMALEQFQTLVEGLSRWEGEKFRAIKLYNRGEPLLNPDFPHILRCLSRAEVTERIDLTSNCSLLTEALARELIEGGLDYLRISIYSVFPERHRAITGSSVSPLDIHRNVCRLRELREKMGAEKPFLAVKMFDTADPEEKERFLGLYRPVADEVFFEQLHDFAGASPGGISLPTEKLACPWPFYSLTVQWDGTVDCCCVDWEDKNRVGNAFQTPLEEIWRGQALERFRLLQLSHKRKSIDGCKHCSLYLTDTFTVDNLDQVTPEMYLIRQKEQER